MRILILTDYFPTPANPQAGTWALTHARGLADEGADVRVICPTPWIPSLLKSLPKARNFAGCPASHVYGPVRVIYPRWPYYNFSILRRVYARHPWTCELASRLLRGPIRSLFAKWKPDVVFAHHTIPNGLTARWIKAAYKIPYVVEDQDFGSVEDCETIAGRRKGFATVMSDAAAAISPATRITDAYKKLFPDVRAVTIYSGAPPPPAEVRQRPRPVELEGKTVVFSAGFFYERKGIPELIQVFNQAAAAHPEAILRIAGDGPMRPQVDAALAKSEHRDRITLLGKVPSEKVAQEMAWADIFALIGWDEPFANVYLEAMSAGLPILCCNDGGINQLLKDGVHGRAVPPHDLAAAGSALNELLGQPDQRRQMGRNSLALFESQLTASASSRSTLALLGEIA